MADNSILTPGYDTEQEVVKESTEQYLLKDNFLSEYSDENEKAVVRENLNIPSKDYQYSKLETDTKINETIQKAVQNHLNIEDPHGILPQVDEKVQLMVKTDGSTPFTQPQVGVAPVLDSHLTTKKYVVSLIQKHLLEDDPHTIIPQIKQILQSYVLASDVYSKDQLYTNDQIDKELKKYVRRDGTTAFVAPQLGVDPSVDGHLATKRYADRILYNHISDIDPHGFITILNNRLASYAKKKEVLDKSETYSRAQIDSIINNLISTSIDQALGEYQDNINDKIQNIYRQNYIKQDGSTPFLATQSGVDAVADSDLVTLRQVTNMINSLKNNVQESLDQNIWVTSGEVRTTVGFVEDNTPVPQTMTLQELADAIFYGKRISIEVPKYVILSNTCEIKVCIHGDSALMVYAEVYQGDTLIHTIDKEQLVNGCTILQSNPIDGDTTFTLKVYYSNGTIAEETASILCTKPVFVGLLPKFKFASTITMDYLIELANEDYKGTQNRFVNEGKDVSEITFNYEFTDPQLRHPFVVIPKDYPNLVGVITATQSFGIDAFEIIDDIPLNVNGVDVIYKIYVYKQALVSLNSSMTFKFTENESVQ